MKVLFVALALTATQAFAAGVSTTKIEASHRAEKPWGLSLAIGNPHPALAGVVGSYNINDWSRAEIGYGSIKVTSGWSFDESGMHERTASADTLGAGYKIFMPGWNFSPTAGVHLAHLKYSGDGELEVQGYKKSGTYASASLGADWLSEGGYNVNFGTNIALGGGSGGAYFGVGYYF